MIIYVVGGKPHADEPEAGEWKKWGFREYPLVAQEMWNLLSREKVGGGAIDAALDALPKKKSTGKGKAKQQWLIRPDRSRSLDHEFLEFLDESRRDLASDLYKHNDHDTLLEGNLLNESVQCILDRILFLRICEDRDIDTGTTLQNIVETWRRNYGHDEGRKFRQESMRLREDSTLDLDDARSGGGAGSRIAAPRESLWYAIVRHFRALDRRPAGLTPFFNGNLFKLHGSEKLIVGDEWLADFIGELSNDETPYLFNVIPVEILGSVYERFLGKVVRPQGRGIIVEEKPEVRKAGGVYYTPRYIVDYIVEQTVGRQLDGIAGIPAVPNDSQRLENRAATVPEGQQKLAGGGAKREPPDHRPTATSTPDGVPEPHATHSSAPSGAHDSGDADPVAASAAGGLAHRLISDQPYGLRSTATLSLPAFEKATAVLRILDPACGSGSFLIRAFERVCEHWQEWLTPQLPKEKTARAAWEKKHRKLCWVDAETGDIHLTVDLKRRILTENIYGVDLDSAAVEVTQLSLYLKMLENENRTTLQRERELFADEIALLPPLQDNIKCGNSLIASDFSMMSEDLVRVNAFDWDVQFRDIMKAGGFDAVIGNPPYIRIQTMQESDPSTVLFFKERYKAAAKGNYDIYVLFVEQSLNLIRESGRVGFILPNKFLNAEYGAPLREILGSGQHLDEMVHFGANQVFEGATTYTCLLFISRTRTKSLTFRKVDALNDWQTKHIAESACLPSTKLGKDAWSFSVGAGAELIERLKAIPSKLGDVADIFVGLQTSADDVFIMDFVSESARLMTLHSKAKGEEVTLEKGLLHPLASGTDVHGYASLPARQFILFPYDVCDESASLLPWSDIVARFPRTAEYLGEMKARLAGREKGKFRDAQWYRFGRSQNLGIQSRNKLCVPRLVDRLCAAGDLTGGHFLDNVDVGGVTWKPGHEKHDLRYLLGLLNSGLWAWFFPNVSAPFRGGWYSANRQFLSQLPFRAIAFTDKADKARHDKLVMLVEKMLALTPKLRAAKTEAEKATLQNAVSKTDQDIDALVYELYALTPEEIALVEGGK